MVNALADQKEKVGNINECWPLDVQLSAVGCSGYA